jgi:hypothetical protein
MMEHTQPLIIPLAGTAVPARLPRIPLVIYLSAYALAFLTVVMTVVIALAKVDQRPASLLLSFRDTFLNHPISRLTNYPFTCRVSGAFESGFAEDNCVYVSLDGPFSQVRITMLNSTSHTMTVTVRDGLLELDDLTKLWGQPLPLRIPGRPLGFYWPSQHVLALVAQHESQRDLAATPLGQVTFSAGS